MNAHWTFEMNHLVAKDHQGQMLMAWKAETDLGEGLAELLNHAPALSSLVLSAACQKLPRSDSVSSGGNR